MHEGVFVGTVRPHSGQDGTTVVWRNTEGFHTVLSADFLLQSEPLDVGGTYSYTFTKPGTYPYECGIHPEMVAAIQVVP